MISIQDLKVEFSSQLLFDNVSFVINKKDKIALVGKNGAGKSTMLKIIAGLQSPSSGTVSKSTDLTIGYLPQQMTLVDKYTVKEEVMKAFDHIKELDSQIAKMNQELAERTDYDSADYQDLIDRLTHKNDLRAMYQAENYEAEIEKTLLGLGFDRTDFDRPTSEFSGGWRMRIEIAKLLLKRPDVLLLDEPTNHLDIESIQWLENFLKLHANSLLLVSHDKAFIDNVTNRTIEISCGKIYDYNVNYSHFVQLREQRVEQQLRAYENQQKMIHDTQEFIEKFRYKPTKAVQVQSRIKQLAKIVPIEVDEVDTSRLRLKFPPAPRSGDYPVIAEDVSKTYGEHNVFHDVTFTIKRGEKVAFVGKNGAGKSTLVKCIMGEIPFEGNLKIGHNVKIGYFAQNQAQLLDGELTVFDTIDQVAVGDIRTRINDILGAFMFGGPASEKKVKVLSGGEKSRLAMIRLLLQPVNLLIMDEPTNHLDMRTKDILKDAIKDFNGTVIVVSHDRDFLDGLVEKVYEFGGGHVKEHLGGIYDFLAQKNMESLHELEKKEQLQQGIHAAKNVEQEVKQSKLNYQEQKELNKKIKQAEKRVSELEQHVNDLENQINCIEQQLAQGGEVDPDIYNRHSQLNAELEQTMTQWEDAGEELEKIKQ
ncbi:MAG: ABC-F family ATP-binding cassette domain-containing protein [Sodaliphilus pleomorphus]|jgi:ATP-binding cassette subfamily F protein 3|uniref:ABC-F family ATP-binding cassette domain-containing protein n=1 Tax=Sodaliphilus pleomorphus TaxID=2606626 RepID=UPI00240A3E3E|nr:ABC-F family ATP-binding cassette domain-containing protein [Sodaliphilus pleomorphus]MDD6475581.1 ABC-F family ATP-binding cassette domain-containing protein [Sodaliphilus pleomorphus]